MTVQWTFVAGYLYTEIAVICLLLLPFISPTIWQSVFKSRLCNFIADKANLFFSIIIAILVLFFVDSIREMRKYSSVEYDQHAQLGAEIQVLMKLFRAQRNFYIAGFSLFLSFVIRRLVTLLSNQACLLEEGEEARKKAQSATELSQRLLREKEQAEKSAAEAAENYGNLQEEKHKKEVGELQHSLVGVQHELSSVKDDLVATKNKALAVGIEYKDLLAEYNKLLEENMKLRKSTDDSEDDKSTE